MYLRTYIATIICVVYIFFCLFKKAQTSKGVNYIYKIQMFFFDDDGSTLQRILMCEVEE